MKKVLVVDIGTTNLKAGVVDEKGKVFSYAEESMNLHKPEKGAVEHNPQELYSNFKKVCRKAIAGFEDKISLLVLSAYQCGFLPVDSSIKPLCGIVTLLDTRCEKSAEELKRKYDIRKIYNRTGCPPFFIYALPKVLWLKKKKPRIFSKTRYFLGSKDYIIYRLTGEIFTEPSLASATQMFNIHSLEWDSYALDIAGISRKNLPDVIPPDKILCKLSAKAKGELGLKGEVSILPGVYDGGTIAIGLGGFSGKAGVMNLGTTAMLRISCSAPLLDKKGLMRFQTYYLCGGRWLTGGAINNAGIPLQWLKDNILFSGSKKKNLYNTMFSAAEKVAPGSDNLFFLPFIAGERDPRIGNFASGVFFGLKDYHRQAHLVRSSIEGASYSLRFIKEALRENGVVIKEVRIGGGGSRSKLWVQVLSDVMNLPVRTIKSGYTPLLGGAILGYTALGRYNSIEKATNTILKLDKSVKPVPENVKIYNRQFKFFSFLLNKMGKVYPVHARL